MNERTPSGRNPKKKAKSSRMARERLPDEAEELLPLRAREADRRRKYDDEGYFDDDDYDDFDDEDGYNGRRKRARRRQPEKSRFVPIMIAVFGGVSLLVIILVGVFVKSISNSIREEEKRYSSNYSTNIGANSGSQDNSRTPSLTVSGNQSDSFMLMRPTYNTRLTSRGPAPEDYENTPPPKGVRRIEYNSGSLKLFAWFAFPENPPDGLCPAVIYFHGGFSLAEKDWNDAKPFLDAGYALMCPTFRAENGNPGDFEMFYGEVDDARAAIRWLASQQDIDGNRIATFGHGVGGGISALVAMFDEPNVWITGSSGGIYGTEIFDDWRDICPFDTKSAFERGLRTMTTFPQFMKFPHVAFVGADNQRIMYFYQQLNRKIQVCRPKPPYSGCVIPACDQREALAPSVQQYIRLLSDFGSGRWNPGDGVVYSGG
ncbi:MAG: hypothetical protein NUW37_13695 [Planctomycetes bacterium]|nr:hypothetical protein [Planctomycetota bacterium]